MNFKNSFFIRLLSLSTLCQTQEDFQDTYDILEWNEIDSADNHNLENSIDLKKKEVIRYSPTWESLDSRPLPNWYDKSKVGIFIHWGVFSVPAFGDAWLWKFWKDGQKVYVDFIKKNYKPNITYQEFAPDFTAEFFNPVEWAELFQKSGAKYVVLTSKHHEGYTLWPSNVSFSWNAMDIGPHRDLVRELANAIRKKTNIKFGLYHSLYEFFNPLWLRDKNNQLQTDTFVKTKTIPELYEIVNSYKPEVIWSDGDWEAPDTYWKSEEFLAWLYNDSPVKNTVVTNDRWGKGTPCKHGGFYNCQDKFNPGYLFPHKWENCFTLDKKSWGHRKNAKLEDYLTPEDLIATIVETVSCGGNVLVNVGPKKDGMIEVIQEERLLQMGEWLGINGEAIYNSVPFTSQNDTLAKGVWYTLSENKTIIYGMMTKWPGEYVTLGSLSSQSRIRRVKMLGAKTDLQWLQTSEGIQVNIPKMDQINSKWAWTLVFEKAL